MCGRYGFIPGEHFNKRFQVENDIGNLETKYNVAPSYDMPIITKHSPNKVSYMKWGLIPYWVNDPSIGYKMINARAETIIEKPSFRKAFLKQRCLVPASGFYEWNNTPEKIPYYFRLKQINLFSFAGLYDVWKDQNEKEIYSYTIITTTPNKIVSPIHCRMPVILHQKDEEKWLNPNECSTEILQKFLVPYSGRMESYPISKEINNPDNDYEELLKPWTVPTPNQTLF